MFLRIKTLLHGLFSLLLNYALQADLDVAVTICSAKRIAVLKLPVSAVPVPAKSSAVP